MNCFATYEECSSSEGEFEDVAAGSRMCKVPYDEGDTACRAYCACGKTLKRVAKLPDHAALLACSSTSECNRCDDVILAGELHFRCSQCDDTRVCKNCGPGVYIGSTFDFFDKATGEMAMQDVPSKVLHYRKSRLVLRAAKKTRGVSIGSDDTDAIALKAAEQVVENARGLMKEVHDDKVDMSDKDWFHEDTLLRLLGASSRAGAMEISELLIAGASRIFAAGPTLQEVKAPCKIFGDTHGQLRDVLLLFGCFGFPGTVDCPVVVFNGDVVDRGAHQVELLMMIFALKIAMPDKVFINRGNHEDAHMNVKYGFNKAVIQAMGPEQGPAIFEMIGDAFSYLPLATRINDKILIVHGGIGDGKWDVHDLREVKRPLHHPDLQKDSNQWIWNLLWSDPIEDDDANHHETFGVHESPRGPKGTNFGWDVTKTFCARNGLSLIVRSHQSKQDSLGFDIMHENLLMRVFSARDYEGHGNDGSVLLIEQEAAPRREGQPVMLTVRPQVLCSTTKAHRQAAGSRDGHPTKTSPREYDGAARSEQPMSASRSAIA
mmetsp:Transcript_86204/g.219591  ORF Transcript_86204/g.219591 Transcript_86204/m.219591 type:complete len:546 (-) Transcript_86204:41-1678(-)